MKRDGWADYPFSFHDSEELGPAILATRDPSRNPGSVGAIIARMAGMINIRGIEDFSTAQ